MTTPLRSSIKIILNDICSNSWSNYNEEEERSTSIQNLTPLVFVIRKGIVGIHIPALSNCF